MAAIRYSALALCTLLLAVVAVPALADEFSEFRVPDHRVLLWDASTLNSGSWSSTTTVQGRNDSGYEHGSLGSAFYDRRESEPRAREVRADLSVYGNREHEASRTTSPYTYTMARERMTQDANLSADLGLLEQWFPEGSPVNLSLTLQAALQDGRQWGSRHDEQFDPVYGDGSVDWSAIDTWRYRNQASGSLGLGIGRVRNVTGVYEALVLEQRLLASGALTRRLGAVAKRELAALLYVRSDYSTTMDRPAATVWGTIQDILRRDGSLADPGIDARKLFDAVNPFLGPARGTGPDATPHSPILRRAGWAVQVVLDGNTNASILKTDERASTTFLPANAVYNSRQYYRMLTTYDEASAGLVAEFHRPAGPRWQLDADFSTLVPVRTHERGFTERSDVSATWIVTDRWLVSAWAGHMRSVFEDAHRVTRTDTWSFQEGGSCQYWLADRAALDLTYSQEWDHVVNRYDPWYSIGPTSMQSGRFSVGLNYRFAGFTQIPGIGGLAR